jgi:hypothetical protein
LYQVLVFSVSSSEKIHVLGTMEADNISEMNGSGGANTNPDD